MRACICCPCACGCGCVMCVTLIDLDSYDFINCYEHIACMHAQFYCLFIVDLPDSCLTRLVGARCYSPVEQISLPYHTDPFSLPPSDAARLDKVKLNKER